MSGKKANPHTKRIMESTKWRKQVFDLIEKMNPHNYADWRDEALRSLADAERYLSADINHWEVEKHNWNELMSNKE